LVIFIGKMMSMKNFEKVYDWHGRFARGVVLVIFTGKMVSMKNFEGVYDWYGPLREASCWSYSFVLLDHSKTVM